MWVAFPKWYVARARVMDLRKIRGGQFPSIVYGANDWHHISSKPEQLPEPARWYTTGRTLHRRHKPPVYDQLERGTERCRLVSLDGITWLCRKELQMPAWGYPHSQRDGKLPYRAILTTVKPVEIWKTASEVMPSAGRGLRRAGLVTKRMPKGYSTSRVDASQTEGEVDAAEFESVCRHHRPVSRAKRWSSPCADL